MRPRKVILCVDSNEQALSVRKFMLETRGYRAICVLNAQAALERFEAGGVDMVLLSGTVKDFSRADAADAFLPKGANNSLELLERIRVLMVRKRGPKRQSERPAFSPSYAS
jgi:CheY-like chemotaxis protein